MPVMDDDNRQPSREPESQAEREAASIIEACLLDAPQGEAQEEAEAKRQEEENIFLLTDRAALSLDCIALVRGGEIVPLYNMRDLPRPRTMEEKMRYAVYAAEVLLNGVVSLWEAEDEGREKK
jgi:hypothetical protein